MAETIDKKAKKGKGAEAAAEPEQKGKGRGRGEPEPQAPAKKSHPVRNTMLFTSLFFVVLIGAVIGLFRLSGYSADGDYVYWLDPEGVIRGPIWLFLNPEEEPREVIYESEIADVYELEAEYEEKLKELELREAEMDYREGRLDDREDYLSEREDLVNEWFSHISENNAQVTSNNYDITDMAKRVAGMDPKKAALMLTEMEEESVLQILLAMKPAEASKILNNMEADDAAVLIALGLEVEEYDYPDTRPGAVTPPPAPTIPPVSEAPGPEGEPAEEPGPSETEATDPNSEPGEIV